MPQIEAPSSKASDQGSYIGIRAQPALLPIIEESGNTTPPPLLAAKFGYLRDMVIRNSHQMEEMRIWMKKSEDDWSSDGEEFKSLLMDIQLKSGVGSGDRGPEPPSPRSKSVHASHSERSISHNREGPLLPTPPHFQGFSQAMPTPPPMNYSYNGYYRPIESTYQHKPRPEFPVFSGTNIHGWLYRAEQLLEFYNISPNQRVRMAALYLYERPLQWYHWSVAANSAALEW